MAAQYVAGRMASKKAEGMLSPLLGSDDDSTDTGSNASDASSVERVKQTPMEKLKSYGVYTGLMGGTALSVASIVLFPGPATMVMGGLCAVNAQYAVYKEHKIQAVPTLRYLNSKLQEDANELEAAVDVLAEEIDLLGPEADRAAVVEEELAGIAEAQEVNVNKLVDLVKENAVILAKMRDNLRQRIVQDIIHIVVKSDRDNDQIINRQEAQRLALRIRISLQEYGVLFDSDKFLRAIGGDTTVPAVLAIVQKLLPREQKRGAGYDSDYDSGEESDMDEDDVFDMFHMVEEGSRASDGSTMTGGKGVSLMTCDKKGSGQTRRRQLLSKSKLGKKQRSKAYARSSDSEEDSSDSSDGDY